MLSIEISSNTDWITSRWCVEQVKSTLLFLLYQRLQIPVPYPTLKQLVERLKNVNPNDDDENRKGSNFFLEKQRSLAIDTFDNVEQLIGILERQVITLENDLEYAAITFGPSPVLSKEVWFIRLPEIDREHKNENHIEYLQRAIGQTILTLIQDEKFSPSLSSNLPLTNIHILFKGALISPIKSEDCLEEIEFLQLPKSCKTFLIDLSVKGKTPPSLITCRCVETEIEIFEDALTGLEIQCNQLTIMEEEVIPTAAPDYNVPTLSDVASGSWFRLNAEVKGFKDDTRNGKKIWIC